jgi:hypothetical protein
MEPSAFAAHFEAEVRRLGLDPLRLTGLTMSGTGAQWQEQLLAHMRSLAPGADWTDVLPEARAGSVADTNDVDRDLIRAQAIGRELERVIPAETRCTTMSGASWGISFPHGPAHALQVLQRLPDGVGAEAVLAALATAPTKPREL